MRNVKIDSLRVLHITPYYVPSYRYGGPVNSICQLCEGLANDVKEVCVYTTGSKHEFGEKFYYQELNGVKVSYFNRFFYENAFFAPKLIWEVLLNARKFDIIHLHMWWNLTTMLSLIIVLLRGKKPVLSPRGTLSEYSFQHRNSWIKKTFQRLLGKYLFKNTYLHCTSSMELEQSTHFFQWSGIDIIPNHVALPQITEGHGHQETGNKIELLFLSRIDPIKGIHYLLEALSKVNFRFHLTIAGSGDSEYVEQLKQQAVELGVHQSVSWIGFVRGKEKHDLFLQHDLLVLTSETENFGNVIIESLSVGTPVLISKNVGLSDYVEEHDLGWICSLEVDDIVNQLQAAYHDKVKRQHIKRKAYLIVREDFAPESLTHRYVSYYMHTLQKTPNWLKAV